MEVNHYVHPLLSAQIVAMALGRCPRLPSLPSLLYFLLLVVRSCAFSARLPRGRRCQYAHMFDFANGRGEGQVVSSSPLAPVPSWTSTSVLLLNDKGQLYGLQ